jgi:hypothetical protein
VRLSGFGSETFNLVLFISLEVSFEPIPVRWVIFGALIGQDVSRDSVEEPTIVRNNHCTTRELEKSIF